MIRAEEIEKKYGVKVEVLKRLGTRWAILTSLYHTLSKNKIKLPPSAIQELRTARLMIDSGCFSICDINCTLDKAESILIPRLASSSKGFENFDHWLILLGKAMRDQLTPEELRELPHIRPFFQNCEFLKCTCV